MNEDEKLRAEEARLERTLAGGGRRASIQRNNSYLKKKHDEEIKAQEEKKQREEREKKLIEEKRKKSLETQKQTDANKTDSTNTSPNVEVKVQPSPPMNRAIKSSTFSGNTASSSASPKSAVQEWLRREKEEKEKEMERKEEERLTRTMSNIPSRRAAWSQKSGGSIGSIMRPVVEKPVEIQERTPEMQTPSAKLEDTQINQQKSEEIKSEKTIETKPQRPAESKQILKSSTMASIPPKKEDPSYASVMAKRKAFEAAQQAVIAEPANKAPPPKKSLTEFIPQKPKEPTTVAEIKIESIPSSTPSAPVSVKKPQEENKMMRDLDNLLTTLQKPLLDINSKPPPPKEKKRDSPPPMISTKSNLDFIEIESLLHGLDESNDQMKKEVEFFDSVKNDVTKNRVADAEAAIFRAVGSNVKIDVKWHSFNKSVRSAENLRDNGFSPMVKSIQEQCQDDLAKKIFSELIKDIYIFHISNLNSQKKLSLQSTTVYYNGTFEAGIEGIVKIHEWNNFFKEIINARRNSMQEENARRMEENQRMERLHQFQQKEREEKELLERMKRADQERIIKMKNDQEKTRKEEQERREQEEREQILKRKEQERDQALKRQLSGGIRYETNQTLDDLGSLIMTEQERQAALDKLDDIMDSLSPQNSYSNLSNSPIPYEPQIESPKIGQGQRPKSLDYILESNSLSHLKRLISNVVASSKKVLLQVNDLTQFDGTQFGIAVNEFVQTVTSGIMAVPGGMSPRIEIMDLTKAFAKQATVFTGIASNMKRGIPVEGDPATNLRAILQQILNCLRAASVSLEQRTNSLALIEATSKVTPAPMITLSAPSPPSPKGASNYLRESGLIARRLLSILKDDAFDSDIFSNELQLLIQHVRAGETLVSNPQTRQQLHNTLKEVLQSGIQCNLNEGAHSLRKEVIECITELLRFLPTAIQ